MRGRRWTALSLAAIGAAALALRVPGLQFGLPAVYNPDEVAILARALTFAKGTLNPQNFVYPTFYFYVLFGWVGIYLAGLVVTGRVASLEALRRLYFAHPTGLYTAGRALGAVSGTATVLLLYRTGRDLVGRRGALAASVFLAVAPLHVRDSHYIKHDVFATLMVVLSYLAIARVWPAPRADGPRTADLLAAGGACGAAFSTHYYCIFLALPLAWAIVQAWRPRGWEVVLRRLGIAAAASLVAFVVLSPHIALEPLTAWRDITANRQIVVDRAVESGAFAPAARYLEILWTDSISRPVVALAAAGAAWMLVQAPARAVLLLAFPVPFFVFIMNTFPASRYLNPLLPFIALFAGWCLAEIAARVRAGDAAVWIAAAALALSPAMASVRSNAFFRQDDTRALAQRFIEAGVPAGAGVAIQPHSVVLTPTRGSLIEALTRNVGSADAASTKFQLQLSLDPYPSPAYRLIYLGKGGLDADKIYVAYEELGGKAGLGRLRELGVKFVVVKRYNRPEPATQKFLDALGQEARLVGAFSPYRASVSPADARNIEPFLHNTDATIHPALERPGPPLEVWQLEPGRGAS